MDLTGLRAATRYTFRAYSDNSCTTELAAADPFLTQPPQVTGVRVTPGALSLNVGWTSVTGTVTGYKVQWKSGNESYNTTTRQKTVTSGASTTITGLTNAAATTVRVTATNASGDGTPSSDVTVTPGNTRVLVWNGAVSDQRFTVGSGVNLTLPAATGTESCPVGGYALTTAGAGTTLTLPAGLSWNAATRTLSGTPSAVFAADEFSYRATKGNSGDSSCKDITQNFNIAVQGVTLTASLVEDDTARLRIVNHTGNWYYKYTTPTGGACSAVVSSGTTTVTLTNLTAGTSYTFKAYSDSNCTTELTSAATDAELLTRPGQVSGVGITAGNQSLSVYWNAVAGTVAGYKVQWKSGSEGYNTTRQKTVASGTSTVVTGLVNGTAYTVRVTAANATGDGAASTTVTRRPGTETLTSSGVTHNTAMLTLGSHIGAWYTQYTVPTGGSCSAVVAAGTATVSLTGLSGGTSYTYKAYSDSGCTTELATATPFLTKPAQVGGVTVTEGNESLDVSWTAATGTVSGYKVQWKSGTQSYDTDTRQRTVTSGTSTTITGLTNATVHTVRVTASNASGDGPTSTEVTGVPSVLCDRTPAVREAIEAALNDTCGFISNAELATLTGTLDLNGTVSSLKAGDFAGLSNLTTLRLRNNSRLSSLPAGIFDPLTALNTLEVKVNNLTTLPAGVFDKLTNLTDLTLDNNGLTSLSAGVFDKLTKLDTLKLYGNNLTSLPAGVFDKLTKLSNALDLGYNRLTSLPDGIFDKLTSFAGTIYLDGNNYTTLPHDIFENLAGTKTTIFVSTTLTCMPFVPDSVKLGAWDDMPTVCGADVVLSRSSLSVGASGSTTYTLALAGPPNNQGNGSVVTITPTSSATGKATVSPATLTFTPSNWSTPQPVTVSGVATGTATVSHSVSGGGYDSTSGGVTVDSVAVTVTASKLSGSDVTTTTATLTLTGHAGSWSYQYVTPRGDICSTVATGTTTASLDGLTAGTTYLYKAYSGGSCTAANELTSQVLVTRPGQVSGVTLAADNGSLGVSWTAVSGATGYKVQWKSGAEEYNTGSRQRTVSGGTSTTITGLTNTTAYTVRVTASNAGGDGAASTEATGTPVAVSLAASAVETDTATLTLSNHGGDWYHNYTAPTGGSCSAVVSSGTTTANLTGLSGNTSYTYKAYSDSGCTTELTNAAGAAGFLTKPAQPSQPVASAGAGSGTLTVTATVSGGSGALSKWQVTMDNGATWSDVSATATTLNHVVTGLTGSTSYTVKVRAVNSTGTGPASAASEAVAPTAATLTASGVTSTTALLTISGYTSNWYTKYTAPSGGVCSAVVSSGTTTANLTGLSGNTSYTFRVYSDSGCTTQLAAATPLLTRPAQPFKPSASAGAGSGALTVTAVLPGGSGALSKWQISTDNGATWSDVNTTATSLSTVVTNLTDGNPYSFKVRAVNTTGTGPASVASDATAPSAVRLRFGSVTDSSATLTLGKYSGDWYTKYTSPAGGVCSAVVSSGTTTANLTGLSGNTSYTFRVYSDSSCGTELAAVTFATRAVSLSASSVTDSTALLTLGKHSGDWYTKYTSPSGGVCSAVVSSGTTTASLTGLSGNTSYTWKAYSDSGCSTELAAVTFATRAVSLSASAVTHDTALLTLGKHSGDWYTKYTSPSGGVCSAVVSSGTTTANLTGLSGNTSYTFRVYSDSGCDTELADRGVCHRGGHPECQRRDPRHGPADAGQTLRGLVYQVHVSQWRQLLGGGEQRHHHGQPHGPDRQHQLYVQSLWG